VSPVSSPSRDSREVARFRINLTRERSAADLLPPQGFKPSSEVVGCLTDGRPHSSGASRLLSHSHHVGLVSEKRIKCIISAGPPGGFIFFSKTLENEG